MSRPVSSLDYARAFTHRGEAQLGLGMQAEALINFERALGFDPQFVAAHLGLAKTLIAMEQDQSALHIYERLRTTPFSTKIDPAAIQSIEQAIQEIAHRGRLREAKSPQPSRGRVQSTIRRIRLPSMEVRWYKRMVPVLGVALSAAFFGPWLEQQAFRLGWFEYALEVIAPAPAPMATTPAPASIAVAPAPAPMPDPDAARNADHASGSPSPSSQAVAAAVDRASSTLRYRPHLPGEIIQNPSTRTVRHLDGPQCDRIANYIVEQFRSKPALARAVVHEAVIVGKQLHLDPLLLLAIIAVESRFDPMARSNRGAQGLMQVQTSVHSARFDSFGGAAAAFDFATNMRIGAEILREHLIRHGSVDLALKHYVGAAKMAHDQGYAAKVREAKSKLEAIWSQSSVGPTPQKSSG